MKQKLEDLKLRLKTDRRIWAVGGFILVVVMFSMFAGKERKLRQPIDMSASPIQSPGTGMQESYRDLTMAFKTDIENLTRASKEQATVLKRVATDLREHKARTTGIFETVVDRLEELGKAVDRLEQNRGPGNASVEVSQNPNMPPQEQDTLEAIGFDKADVPLPPAPPAPTRVSVISPGDAVEAELLTGVNAPVDGTPYPVVFRLQGAINGAGGSSLDIGDARLIAAAQGSETDGRVIFRLTDLSIRHNDGRRSVVRVDGWVVGEDGVRGMKGTLIDKLGQLIVATAGVSAAAALGTRLEDRASSLNFNVYDNVKLENNDFQYAGVSAITDASNRLGQILLDRYEKLVPVVEVLSGRKAVIIFSQPAEIEILGDDESASAYTTSLN